MIIESFIFFGTMLNVYLTIRQKLTMPILLLEGFTIVGFGIILIAEYGFFGPWIPIRIWGSGQSAIYIGLISGLEFFYIGVSVLVMAGLLILSKILMGLTLKTFVLVLPWTLTGVYRHLHELIWQFQYWTTENILQGGFSDRIPGISGLTYGAPPSNPTYYFPAVYTHIEAIAFVFYLFLSLMILKAGFT